MMSDVSTLRKRVDELLPQSYHTVRCLPSSPSDRKLSGSGCAEAVQPSADVNNTRVKAHVPLSANTINALRCRQEVSRYHAVANASGTHQVNARCSSFTPDTTTVDGLLDYQDRYITAVS
jgi:hypothetical protein